MAKATHATARDYRRKTSSSVAEEADLVPVQPDSASFLLVKNLLFWGSVLLTCLGLYAAGRLLLG